VATAEESNPSKLGGSKNIVCGLGTSLLMQQFNPGEKAVFAGVYKVVHGSNHELPHHVTVLNGDTFPVCTGCGRPVRFEIAISATRVHAHEQFQPKTPRTDGESN
jgi:hypothetical protein